MKASRSLALCLAGLAAVLVLFPFDWLSDIWPAYAFAFDRVFATSLAHHIGHTSLFFLAGLLVLCSIERLRNHPFHYTILLLAGSFGEEFFQSLSKWQRPNIGDVRDIGFDTLGFVLAYLLFWICWPRRKFWKA